jgi:hypothetical protein
MTLSTTISRFVAVALAWSASAALSYAGHHAPHVPVPPSQEIEVLDPGVDPKGRPAIELSEDENGVRKVEIAPSVLVHRFYYTGDRTFQGPMLPGGPSIVVANHPRTGERCYIEVQMLPGAPRVTYCGSSIEYHYPLNTITVHFPILGGPKVKYCTGRPITKQIAGAAVTAHEECKSLWQRTGIPDRTKNLCAETKTITKNLAGGVNTTTEFVLTPVRQVVQVLPFGTALTSATEERAAALERDRKVQQAAERNRALDGSLRTLR